MNLSHTLLALALGLVLTSCDTTPPSPQLLAEIKARQDKEEADWPSHIVLCEKGTNREFIAEKIEYDSRYTYKYALTTIPDDDFTCKGDTHE